MLVSEFNGGRIDRINLTSPIHPLTQLWPPSTGNGSGNPEGLAYDNSGRLFANLGTRGQPTDPPAKFVAQIDPVTGTILNQSPCPPCLSSLDGLTYDPFTNMLYAASLFGQTVYRLNPNNLSSPPDDLRQLYGWTSTQIHNFFPDGITADGSGHLFAASAQAACNPPNVVCGDGHIYDIDLTNGTLTPKQLVPLPLSGHLDDLAPASGLGAPPGEPFPGQQCCGEKPNYEDPAYATVFTGQLAVATCYSDLGTNPVLAIEDLKNQATAPLDTNYVTASYHGPGSSWTRDNLGDIFGVTLDDAGNIYVTATTSYNIDIYPTTSNSAMNVYKVASGSGAISVFKTLPQSPATPPGAGLGNIAYDCTHKNFYVSNIDDGLIYRLDLSGNILSTWDHGLNLPTALPPSAAIPDDPRVAFTPLGRRVWGLQPHNNRLYYGVWWQDERANPTHANEVWSIALSSAGGFVAGTDQLEISMPPFDSQSYSNPVSDISFGPTGTMLVAERSMSDDTTPDAHKSRALEYMLSGTSWIPTGHVFDIGDPSIATTSAAGGVDYDFGAGGRVWATGDALHYGTPDFIYGLQGLPATGGSIVNSILIDLNGITSSGDDKTKIGDVEIPCPDCEISGTVVTPWATGAPYTYQFTITNHSNQAASNIVILPVSGVTSITPQTIHLSTPLQPGQTSQTLHSCPERHPT